MSKTKAFSAIPFALGHRNKENTALKVIMLWQRINLIKAGYKTI
jgi:hypothetical protein